MSIQIQVLGVGELEADTDIVPEDSDRTTIVKSLRFVNTGEEAATITVKIMSDSVMAHLLPPDMSIPAGFALVEDAEVTLNKGDKIFCSAVTGTVDFVASGVRRDE